MNSLRLLEFDRIRERLAEKCSYQAAASQALALEPIDDTSVLVRTGKQVAELMRFLSEGFHVPGIGVADVDSAFAQVRIEGGVAELEALHAIRRLVDSIDQWRRFFAALTERGDDLSVFAELNRQDDLLPRLRDELHLLISDDGSLNEDAIPEVRQLRGAITEVRGEIRTTAAALIRHQRDVYREDLPTIRDGRIVLPLRADFRGRVNGIIHEASGSGDTLFVEPEGLVDLNNRGVRLEAEVHAAIHRRLRALSVLVRESLVDLEECATRLGKLDLLAARARYGVETRGSVLAFGSGVDLREARHPLLGESCVPLTIQFDADTRLLVLSGPNTGGKTVLLKTLGLLAVMNQCSIPIPAAADSSLPIFSDFAVSIGDEQSIDAALSTFSAHVYSLASIASQAGSHSLVLLDELAGGTDPEEGAALAMGLIDFLLARRATILVTTHLTVLKHYGYTRSGATNAAMEFDETTHLPTYRVVAGRPGSSHALDTARRYGLPEEVLTKAYEYLEDRSGSVGEILRRLQEEERELRGLRVELEREQTQLRQRHDEVEELARETNKREVELRRGKLRELDAELIKARSELETEVRRVREQSKITDAEIKEAHQTIQAVTDLRDAERARIDALDSKKRATSLNVSQIHEGMAVRHINTGRRGTVRSIQKKRVEVQFDVLRMSVRADELQIDDSAVSTDESVVIDSGTVRTGSTAQIQLDIRGYRLVEAVEALEAQIDAAVLHHMARFTVIHGTGTGVLKKAVHEYLRDRPEVSGYDFAPADQGGFGKTVVELDVSNG